MATYVNDLRLKEIATGDESGTWGTSTNTNLELIGEAFSFGTEAITTNADTHTTTIADGSTDPGRSLYLKYTGTLDSACTITIGPNTVSKLWFIENGTSGSQNIIIKQGSGATITVPPGDTKAIYSDGAGSGGAMVDAFASLSVVDLKVQDDLTVTDDMTVGGTLGVTGIVTLTDDLIIGDGKTIGSASDVDAMTIASNGQVTFTQTLIGTALDISGDIDVDGTTNLDVVDIDGALTQDGGAVFNEASADVDFRVESNGNANMLFVDAGNNRVGIGTGSPSNNLEIFTDSGDEGLTIKSTGNTSNAIIIDANRSSAGNAINQLVGKWNGTAVCDIQYLTGSDTTNKDNGQIKFFTASAGTTAERMVIDDEGLVGIGTSSPTEKLTVNGALAITGALADDRTSTAAMDFSGGVTRFISYGASGTGGIFAFRTASGGASSTERMRITADGTMGFGMSPLGTNNGSAFFDGNVSSKDGFMTTGTDLQLIAPSATNTLFVRDNGNESMRIDSSGRLLVGLTGASGFGTLETTSFASDGSCYLARSSGNVLVGTTNNSMSLKVCVNGSFGSVTSGNGNRNFIVNTVSNENWNAAGTVVYCGKNGTTGRSINAGGTINASGADYAEYMKKADSCGTIAKGDVCGVDSTGKLTDVFADAISFVIKSTDPSYVGGDTWGDVDLGLTEEQTETERQKYDRIAFSGQVPVNITGSFNVGDYVYPQANGTDIECVAKSSPTFEEYQLCVGKIWATEDDGRPLVAVKIG